MQNQLIPVASRPVGSESIPTVNARDLHSFLEVGKDFSGWIKDRITQFDFSENQDFVITEVLSSPNSASAKARPQVMKEYALSLDMAKELSMVERNAKGKQARQYFIECERVAKSVPALPTDPMAILKLTFEAMEQSNQRLAVVETKLQELNDNIRMHQWQCYELKLAVNNKAFDFHKQYGVEYKQLYPGIWNRVKLEMRVSSYPAIPATQFDKALAFVKSLTVKDMPDYVREQAFGLEGGAA